MKTVLLRQANCNPSSCPQILFFSSLHTFPFILSDYSWPRSFNDGWKIIHFLGMEGGCEQTVLLCLAVPHLKFGCGDILENGWCWTEEMNVWGKWEKMGRKGISRRLGTVAEWRRCKKGRKGRLSGRELDGGLSGQNWCQIVFQIGDFIIRYPRCLKVRNFSPATCQSTSASSFLLFSLPTLPSRMAFLSLPSSPAFSLFPTTSTCPSDPTISFPLSSNRTFSLLLPTPNSTLSRSLLLLLMRDWWKSYHQDQARYICIYE